MPQVILNGKTWDVDLVARGLPGDLWGDCHYEAKLIRVSPGTKRVGRRREILLHEMLHALFPKLTERVVLRAARELDNALQECGERRWRPRKKAA